MTINETSALPSVLTQRQQWVVWRYEHDPKRPDKPKKMPYDPKTGDPADSTDKRTWASYRRAVQACQQNAYSGIGFVFTKDDPFVGGDLDDCIDEQGQIAPWAWQILDTMQSYAEISPSGTGIKFIVEGELPSNRKKRIIVTDDGIAPAPRGVTDVGGIELYSHSRYFTITADRLDTMPVDVRPVNGALTRLYERLTPPEPSYTSVTRPVLAKTHHAARWAEEKMQWIEQQIAAEPAGILHHRRLELGKLAGGIVALGLISAEEATDRLYQARVPDSHNQQERKAIRDGVENGINSPLVLPEFPTEQALIVKNGSAHCPSCDKLIRRSQYAYPGTSEPGWYCATCKFPMIWPADAWQPEFTALGPALPSGLKQERNTTEQAKQTLIHADQLRELTPTTWLIPGVLPTNKLSLVFGPPGQGKSFVLLDIALTVAQFANVIYIAAEDAEDYEDRKEAWKAHHGLSASGLYFWPEPLRLKDLDNVDRFITEAMALRPALIILDPLADCMRGLNERDEEGMGAAVEALNRIRRATEAAVLILHHTGWSTEHERGSSLLRGAARVVSKIIMNEDDLITMSCEKINGGKKFDKKFFRLVSSASGVVPLPASRVTNSGASLTDKQIDVLEFLSLTINKDGVRHGDIVKHFDMAAATVTRTLNKLLEQKLIIGRKKGQSPVYLLEDEGYILVREREDGTRAEDERNGSEARGTRLNWQIETDALSADAKAFHAPQGDVPSRFHVVDGYEESGTAVEEAETISFSDPVSFNTSSTDTPDSNASDETCSTVFQSSSALPIDPAFVPSAPPPYIRGGAEQGTEQADESDYSYSGEKLPYSTDQLWRIYDDRTDAEIHQVATEADAIVWIKEREAKERGEV